jgi:hypothetical protein
MPARCEPSACSTQIFCPSCKVSTPAILSENGSGV